MTPFTSSTGTVGILFVFLYEHLQKLKFLKNIIKVQTGNREAQTPSHTDVCCNLCEVALTNIYVLIDMKKEHARFVWWKD